ncbi:MAG: hypothetical protein RR527_03495 [Clostridia bacterium]
MLIFDTSRIILTFTIGSYGVELHIKIKLMLGLFEAPIQIRLAIDGYGMLVIRLVDRQGKSRPMEIFAKRKQPSFMGGMMKELLKKSRLEEIKLFGAIGIRDDAFSTVMLTGGINILLQTIIKFMLHETKLKGCINPVFDRETFWLDVEGILSIRNTHIIGAIFRQLRKQKEKKHEPSN